MLTKRIHRLATTQEMHDFATRVVEGLMPGATLLLYGELGGGKTTFVQGVAKELGIIEDVTSPTFTIAGEYVIPNHPFFRSLIHVDLYRLSEEQVSDDHMVKELVSLAGTPERLTIIEWADRLGENLPRPAWRFIFNHGTKEGERIVDATQLQAEEKK